MHPLVLGGRAEDRVVQAQGHVLHHLGLGRLVLLRGAAPHRVHLRTGLGPRGLRDGDRRDIVLGGRFEQHVVNVLRGLS